MDEPKLIDPHTKPIFVDHYELVVRDLDMISSYYQNIIGLEKIEGGINGHLLGTGGTPLLTLQRDQNAEMAPRNTAGLFHTAFLLPRRYDLAHFVKHVFDQGIPLAGAADHLVSEALYLTDPKEMALRSIQIAHLSFGNLMPKA